MADPVQSRRLLYQAFFVVLAVAIMLALLLPLHPGPGSFPPPDVLTLMVVAWLLRRPDYVPVVTIAAIFLLADLLFLRPPGLWAALILVMTEFLRNREPGWRDMPFPLEWAVATAAITAVTMANILILALFAVDRPSLGLTLLHLAITIASYPAVVLLTATIFGLRKAAPGEVDQLGHRQ